MATEFKTEELPLDVHTGDVVDYHSIIDGPVTKAGCKVASEPWLLCGSWAVMLEDHSGAVSVDALSWPV